ncbi:MAG: TraR/DksA family transcriptional regulator [Paracoccaceae bacterium]
MEEDILNGLRKQLIGMLSDIKLQDQRGLDGTRTVKLDQQAVGRLSRMDAIQQQAMAKATQARRNQQKQRITNALSRMDDGEFGYCMQCGDQIAEKRLAFDPSAPTCLTCAT